MRATILIVALVALIANAHGSTIKEKIKDAFTPSSMQHHEEKKPEFNVPQQQQQQQLPQQQQQLPQQQQRLQAQNLPQEQLQQQQRGFVRDPPQAPRFGEITFGQKEMKQDFPHQQPSSSFEQQRENLPPEQLHRQQQQRDIPPQMAKSGEINIGQKQMEHQRMPQNVNPNLPLREQANLPQHMDQKNIGMQQPSGIHKSQRFENLEQLGQQRPQVPSSNPREVAADQRAEAQTWWGTRTYQYSWPTYSPGYVWPQYHSHPGGYYPHYHVPGGGAVYY